MGRKRIDISDIIGKQFSEWTVIEYYGRNKQGAHYYTCKCSCGNVKNVNRSHLINGNTANCGCKRLKSNADRFKTHGLSGDRTWRIWKGIKSRCYNQNTRSYKNYGARGIRMSEEWYASYPTFLSDMGKCPSDLHSVDRIDNNGDYCKENCRWATTKEQCNNTRRNVFLEYDGRVQTISQWAEENGIKCERICDRLSRGWSNEQAITLPINSRVKRKRNE